MARRFSYWSGSVAALAACCGIVAACSGSKDGTGFDDGSSSGSSGSGGDGGFGSSGTSGLLGSSGGGVISPDAACAADNVKAQQQPLDMYVMLDQSGSMNESVSGGTKWSAVTAALGAFVNQPSAAGIGVGLQYFGLPPGAASCPTSCKVEADCNGAGPCIIGTCLGCAIGGGGGDSCNGADYAKPEVEIAPLPGVASAITTSMGQHGPNTGTPTSAALAGAITHAKDWATAHPGHVTIAVLATDGNPEACDTDLGHIDSIAAAGVSGTPKILTFVIGVGSSLTALNGIAAAGGTGQSFNVDTGGNVNQQFLDAMNKIRGTALGCQYQIPAPKSGGALDYGTVNVQYTDGTGKVTTVPKVTDKGACPASGDAWYYDNNTKPTQIILCDSSCKVVTGDTKGQVSIVVGCATVLR
jgi:hypothetical protein